MKSNTNRQRTRIVQIGLLVVSLFGFAQAASAATATLAAKHVVENNVTVAYLDAGGQGNPGDSGNPYSDSASVQITINLVAAGPTVAFDSFGSDSIDPVSTNQTINLRFDVTSNANGEDTYSLQTPGTFAGAASGSTESEGSTTPSSLSLGGSSSAAVVTTFLTGDSAGTPGSGTAILVPADDNDADSNINGFVVGEKIVLNNGTLTNVCTVDEIAQSGVANATATIYVDNCGDAGTGGAGAFALAIGDQLGERRFIDVPLTVGTVEGLLNYSPIIQSDTDTGETGTTAAPVPVNIVAVNLDVYKFVRNATTAANNTTAALNCDSGTPFSCLQISGGSTYYASDVTANPGETLEYAILLFNKAGLVTSVVVTDPAVLFTTYVAASVDMIARGTGQDSDASNACDVGTDGTCIVSENGTDVSGTAYYTDGGTITVSGGHNGSGVAVSGVTGGQLDSGEVSVVFFNVTVDGTP